MNFIKYLLKETRNVLEIRLQESSCIFRITNVNYKPICIRRKIFN